jgi:hypothetical protein
VVTLDGRPLQQVSVMLVPEGNGTSRAKGITDQDGVFRLMDSAGQPLAAGRYKVIVVAPKLPGGKAVPAIYAEPKSTPLTVDVPPASGRLEVALRTR